MELSIIFLSKILIFLFFHEHFNVNGAPYGMDHMSKWTTGNNGPHTGQTVRLIRDGNGDITSGPVEIFVSDAWVHVCADEWDLTVANVICKQLGFIRGAKGIATHNADVFGNTNSLVYDIMCPPDATDIQNCDLNSRNCAGNKIAGLTCHENIGCPEGWIAGPSGCYQLSTGHVRTRDFAVKICALRGGHLVTVENEAENHFLSHAFASTINGPVLTGGEKVNGKWMWNGEPQVGKHDVDATFSLRSKLVKVFKWFPGWNGVQRKPSNGKKQTCLFLNGVFRHPNGSDINSDYFFWEPNICKSTRKTMRSGFKFICEKSRDDALLQLKRQPKTGIESDPCGEDEFTCSDQSCISSWWQCDGELDCEDEGDELNCDDCAGMFQCNNGRCIQNELVCNEEDDCKDLTDSDEQNCVSTLEVRLVGGTESSGTVEVTYGGQTGFICDDRFDDKDATVICRMLGFEGQASVGVGSYYGTYFLLDELSCNGTESSLEECGHDGWGNHDCFDWEVAGVECSLIDDIVVELVGGDGNSGRVELVYNGVRGTLCDDQWDNRDARVICRMMGYSDGVVLSDGSFRSGHNSMPILLDGIACSGYEDSIVDCYSSDWFETDCTHDEDAGAICLEDCYDKATNYRGTIAHTKNGEVCQHWRKNTPHEHTYHDDKTFPDGSTEAAKNYCRAPDDDPVPWCYTEDPDVRWGYCDVPSCGDIVVELVGGDEHSGRVELVYNGIRGTICDDQWDNKDARVICRMLGYIDGVTQSGTSFGEAGNSVHILLDEVECSGNEDSIADCASSGWLENDCGHDEDAGVICQKDCYDVASTYRGIIAQTENGRVCQHWWKNFPHDHDYHDDTTFPDDSTVAANNYCRAPDDDPVPWCYTEDPDVRWGYCDVPKCDTSNTMSNPYKTCGRRPMDVDRFRRDVIIENEDENDGKGINNPKYYNRGRVVGGSIADYGMHPWQAGIKKVLSYSYIADLCGATIIDEYWVLSAAHCFSGLRKDQILIMTGDHNNDWRDQHEQEFEAEEIILHSWYSSPSHDYDIALIKLKPNWYNQGIVFNDYVQPACLPSQNTEYEATKMCHISGWGATEDDDGARHLKSAQVPIMDDRTCDSLGLGRTERMVCAGYLNGGTDTCQGDSGGPLVCDIEGSYTLMGIVSFGVGCAERYRPGVYTRVTEFVYWINQMIAENS